MTAFGTSIAWCGSESREDSERVRGCSSSKGIMYNRSLIQRIIYLDPRFYFSIYGCFLLMLGMSF